MVDSPRRILVVEGGGMRGAYAAGALLRLYDEGDRDYDAVFATSSGAASSAYSLAEQPEGISIWKDHVHGKQLVNKLRFLRGEAALDLDYLVGEVFQRRVPLDVARMRARGVPLHVPVTDVGTGEVRYFDATKRDPFPLLRAAMSMPGAAIDAVDLDGRPYIDGGVVDQIPLLPALALGPQEVTVVLTRPTGFVSKPLGRIAVWLGSRRFPGIRTALKQRHERYAATMAALERSDVRFRVVRPDRSIPVERWTTDRARLHAAIEAGRDDAARALQTSPSSVGR